MTSKPPFLTPQQELFLALYTDPRSKTFGNAKQSALEAKYSLDYAENIMALMPEWLSDNIGDSRRLKRAEKRLDQILDLEPVADDGKIDNALIGNQMKAITLITKGIGKAKYSERHEHTGENGKDLFSSLKEMSDNELEHIARGSEEGISEEGTSSQEV